MFSNKTANSKAMAVALVAMLTLCSLAVMVSYETDAASNETYDIYMRTGDQFSYAPEVNLANTTITAEWTAGTGNGITATPSNNVTLVSGTATTAGETTLVLTAKWTNGSLSQTATQTINFHIYDRLDLVSSNGSSEGYTAEQVNTSMGTITTIKADGNLTLPSTTINYTATITGPDSQTSDLFSYSSSTGAVTATRQATDADAGTYTVKIDANYTYNSTTNTNTTGTVTDSDSFTYTITIGKDLAMAGDEALETFVGNSGTTNTYTIKTNYDDNTDGITVNYDATCTNSGYISYTAGANTFSVNTDAAKACIQSGQTSGTFTVTVSASADINKDGDSTDAGETATMDVTVTVFASLEFTTDPEIDGAVVNSSTGNPLDVLATATFEGVNKITYNWGDGTQTTVNVSPDSGSRFSARHVYSNEGTYAVTITAENAQGNTKAILLYDATSGEWATGTEEDVAGDDKTFFEEHGILFLVFAILAVLMIVLFFFVGIQHPGVIVLTVAFVVLAVVCFIFADFGLTEGLIQDLNI